ncbi:MAG: DUF2199 domain-containing protein [Myxococcales bacterium]
MSLDSAKTSSDLCVLDGARFFLRGIAFVPILETADCFGWGFWVEMDRAAFGRYLDLFKADAPEGEPPRGGCHREFTEGVCPARGPSRRGVFRAQEGAPEATKSTI